MLPCFLRCGLWIVIGLRIADDHALAIRSHLIVSRPQWYSPDAVCSRCLAKIKKTFAFRRVARRCGKVNRPLVLDRLVLRKEMTIGLECLAQNRVFDSETQSIANLFFWRNAEEISLILLADSRFLRRL